MKKINTVPKFQKALVEYGMPVRSVTRLDDKAYALTLKVVTEPEGDFQDMMTKFEEMVKALQFIIPALGAYHLMGTDVGESFLLYVQFDGV